MSEGYARVIEELESRDLVVRTGWGGGVEARCPAHDDRRASLSVKEGDDGKALVYCHAGCDTRDILACLDLNMAQLFVSVGNDGQSVGDVYVYNDEMGLPLYRVIRWVPKGFSQQRYAGGEWTPGLEDTRRVLYRLPELRDASLSETIYLVEGEKDVETLRRLGFTATCCPGGAGKWREEYGPALQGRIVCIKIQDMIQTAPSCNLRAQ
jgi:hypothetical protein